MRVTGEESLETAVSICAEWNYARIWSGVWRKAKRKGDQRAEPMDAVSEQKHVYDSAGSRCLCSYLGLKQFKKKPLMSVHFKKKSISSPPEALDHRFSHHAFFLNPEHFELTLCMLGLCPCFNNLFNLKKKNKTKHLDVVQSLFSNLLQALLQSQANCWNTASWCFSCYKVLGSFRNILHFIGIMIEFMIICSM